MPSRSRLRPDPAKEDRRRLRDPVSEGTLEREGPPLSENRRQVFARGEILAGERHASAAARQRTRRLARYRPPRHLFPAGRLRRSGAHGADFAAPALHRNKSLHTFAGGFAEPDHPVYVQPIGTGIQCGNTNCITADPAERQYAANKFYVVEDHRRNAASFAAFTARPISKRTPPRTSLSPTRCERFFRRASGRCCSHPRKSSNT